MKFQLQKTVNSEFEAVRERAIDVFKSSNYLEIEVLDNVIAFRFGGNDWEIVSRSESYKKIKRGKLEITRSEINFSLKLIYFVSLLTEIIIILLFLIGGIFISHNILFLALFMFFILVDKLYTSRKYAEKMLIDITFDEIK
ncbi:hypothetical protein [Pedobacter nutrimenti]|uniref:hypothetical protein n=1 Tax=Pedobacter nutrimenti TaxID=1241337 RepID=UPI00292F7AA1|nr:hypothetical protein [Pedobacter nutrimenti]